MTFETEYKLAEFREKQSEFFDENGKFWRGTIISYHIVEEMLSLINSLESEFNNSESKVSDSAVAGKSCDYTNVPLRTAHGGDTETAVESAFPSTPDTENICDCEKNLTQFPDGRWRCTICWEWWYR